MTQLPNYPIIHPIMPEKTTMQSTKIHSSSIIITQYNNSTKNINKMEAEFTCIKMLVYCSGINILRYVLYQFAGIDC
jgi:hypothetical protein